MIKAIQHIISMSFLCAFAFGTVAAQETEPSPWSRFGMGLTIPTLSSPQLMMGGVSSPIMDGYVINPDQPASAASCISTLFQSSIHFNRSNMTEGDSTESINYGSPGGINLVVKKPGGSSAIMMGVNPYSSKGYNVARTIETDTLIGNYRESYTGAGGTAKSYLGFAQSFKGKKWVPAGKVDSVLVGNRAVSLGAQISFLFGEVISTGRLDIEDLTYLDNRTRSSMKHRSMSGLIGIQAFQLLWANYDSERNFKGSATVYIGATYAPEANLFTDYEKTIETVQFLNNIETTIDTASYTSVLDATGRMPSKYSLGGAVVFENANGRRVQIAADFMEEDWTIVSDSFQEIDILDGDATWAVASRSSIGLTIIPRTDRNNNNILSRSTFKSGFSLDLYPIAFKGNQLHGWKASAGVTVPLEGSRSTSRFHLGVEMGHRGTGIDNGTVLEESLYSLQFGVTLAPFLKNLWLTPKLYD
jgi:hypothetical protein